MQTSQLTSQLLKNLHKFRLITFDVTDTLLKFREPVSEKYAKTAATFGVTQIDERQMQICFQKIFKEMSTLYPIFGSLSPGMNWQQWWIEAVKRIFKCVNNKIPEHKLDKIAKSLLEIYRTKQCWIHIDGVQEFLSKINKTNKIVGVISNFDASLPRILKEMDIEHNFDFVLTSYNAQVEKPNKKIFNIPLEAYDISPNQALHIGNLYEKDYVGAQNAGWSSILVSENISHSLPSHHQYTNIKDMMNALENKEIEL